MSRAIANGVAAFLLSVPGLASADQRRDEGLFTFVLENDVLGERKEDRDYTNGFKLTWMSAPATTPAWTRRLFAWGDRVFSDGSTVQDPRIEFEFGQSMFTPKNLRLAVPDPRDRPYAGLLYGAVGLVGKRDDGSFEQFQGVFGVVGPASKAEQVQREFHKLIGGQDPKGWGTQISNRFAGELRFQRTEPTRTIYRRNRFAAEGAPHWGASLGNLTTALNAGYSVRVGVNLPEDFGPPRVYPSLPGSGYFVPTAAFGWYLFGGVEARYVARSMVLDEPSTLGTHVTRQPWVLDAQYGVAAYWDDFRAAFTLVTRSREFKEWDSRVSSFGALSLTWRY